MAPFTIRPATLDDVSDMAALRTACAWSGGADAAVVTRYLAGTHHPQGALAPRGAWLALSADATLVGYAAGHRTTRFGGDAELQWLLVAPGARGQGVGDALLATFAAWCAAAGARRVLVNVAPENTPARQLYARHGATPLTGHEDFWMVWPHLGARARRTTPGTESTGDG